MKRGRAAFRQASCAVILLIAGFLVVVLIWQNIQTHASRQIPISATEASKPNKAQTNYEMHSENAVGFKAVPRDTPSRAHSKA